MVAEGILSKRAKHEKERDTNTVVAEGNEDDDDSVDADGEAFRSGSRSLSQEYLDRRMKSVGSHAGEDLVLEDDFLRLAQATKSKYLQSCPSCKKTNHDSPSDSG